MQNLHNLPTPRLAKSLYGLALFTLLCFLIAGLFSLVYADDFSYYHHIVSAGFLDGIKQMYLSWNGRYASDILIPLITAVSLHHNWITVYILFGSIFFALWLFFTALLATNSLSKNALLALLFLGFFCLISPLPLNPSHTKRMYYELFFWNAGGTTYLLGLAFSLLCLTCVRYYYHRPSVVKLLFALITAALAIGSDETIMLGLDGLLVGLAILFWQRDKSILWVALIITAALCSTVVILSPGNAIRGAHFSEQHLIGHAAFMTFKGGAWHIINYLINPLFWLFCALFYLPCKQLSAQLNKKITAKWQGIVFFLFISAFFLPAGWATGNPPPGRTIGMISMIILLLMPVILISLLEHYGQKRGLAPFSRFISGKSTSKAYFFMILLSILAFFLFLPGLSEGIKAVLFGHAFHKKVVACELYDKKLASKVCKSPKEYPALHLLGYPNNIKDRYHFGAPPSHD